MPFRRFTLACLAVFFIGLSTCALQAEQADQTVAAAPDQSWRRYSTVPKGVVLEGNAEGMEVLKRVAYDKDTNTFLLNGVAKYESPLDRKEFLKLLEAIDEDDLVGVSKVEGGMMTYGKIDKGSELAKNLLNTDKLLAGVLFGFQDWIAGQKLPNDYKPKHVKDRKQLVIAFIAFRDFHFEKDAKQVYKRVQANMFLQLIPASDKRAPDGGYLPDEEAIKTFLPRGEDQDNLNHLNTNRDEYFKIETVAQTLKYGEAAAFIRTVRDAKISLQVLRKLIK